MGRQAELANAPELLLRADVGLLTFTGPGGVGKCGLALHLAAQLLARFSHGVFLVNPAPSGTPRWLSPPLRRRWGSRKAPASH